MAEDDQEASSNEQNPEMASVKDWTDDGASQ